jgi:hypothetical protein
MKWDDIQIRGNGEDHGGLETAGWGIFKKQKEVFLQATRWNTGLGELLTIGG